MKGARILLGNEAIAYGILGSSASVVTSYPGTPASEICETAFRIVKEQGLPVHVEWSINEKTAFEVAYANAIAGRRSAVAMKQVGLNVASDPVMSAAYMGTSGGLLLIVADDPGPHSSQTEQDTRLFCLYAKIPVLDPSSPAEALRMTQEAFAFSEEYKTPVILRPTTRVCHARQLMEVPELKPEIAEPDFRKDPARWAATPGPRLVLHRELNAKIALIRKHAWAKPRLTFGDERAPVAVVSSGVGHAYLTDVLTGFNRWNGVCLYKVDMPYPMDPAELDRIAEKHATVLVVENEGELTPEIVMAVLDRVTVAAEVTAAPAAKKGRRPSLCPGCAHRGAFYAIKRALPRGIYTSDIGCYTLGLNMGAVDTCLCMGAAVSQAAGFYHAYRHAESPPPIAAIIGDSTYFHAGIPPTINALVTGARFVLVILDNATTAMTGHQPTPATGSVASDYEGRTLQLEAILKGCGVRTVKVHDPYDIKGFRKVMKDAYARTEAEGVTAVIARHPCIRDRQALARQETFSMEVTDECSLCGLCVKEFECPALSLGEEKALIDMTLCIGCGVCVEVCARHAIKAGKRP